MSIISTYLGIIDWAQVAENYGKIFKQNGGEIHMNFDVTSISANDDSTMPLRIKGSDNQVLLKKVYFKRKT